MPFRSLAWFGAALVLAVFALAIIAVGIVRASADYDRAERAFQSCRGVRIVGTIGGDVARLCFEREGSR